MLFVPYIVLIIQNLVPTNVHLSEQDFIQSLTESVLPTIILKKPTQFCKPRTVSKEVNYVSAYKIFYLQQKYIQFQKRFLF
jgi:hypothetical protein